MKESKIIITRRPQSSGHIVVMLEIKGYIYAATYAPGSDVSDKTIRADYRRYGHGKNKTKGFRPYDQTTGRYL